MPVLREKGGDLMDFLPGKIKRIFYG